MTTHRGVPITVCAELFDFASGPAPASTHSERDMLDALHVRYSQTSQGVLRRYVVAEHVRAACGFAGTSFEGGVRAAHARTMRTADFLAQDWRGEFS